MNEVTTIGNDLTLPTGGDEQELHAYFLRRGVRWTAHAMFLQTMKSVTDLLADPNSPVTVAMCSPAHTLDDRKTADQMRRSARTQAAPIKGLYLAMIVALKAEAMDKCRRIHADEPGAMEVKQDFFEHTRFGETHKIVRRLIEIMERFPTWDRYTKAHPLRASIDQGTPH